MTTRCPRAYKAVIRFTSNQVRSHVARKCLRASSRERQYRSRLTRTNAARQVLYDTATDEEGVSLHQGHMRLDVYHVPGALAKETPAEINTVAARAS